MPPLNRAGGMVARISAVLVLAVAFSVTGCLDEDYTFGELFTGKETSTTNTGTSPVSTQATTTTTTTTATTTAPTTTAATTTPTSSTTAPGVALIEAPADPAVGAAWHYNVSGQTMGSSDSTLAAKEQRGGHASSRVESTITSGDTTTESISWIRRSDGAIIETQTTTDVDVGGTPYTITTTTTFDPPCRYVEYPVVSDDAYMATCEGTTETTPGSGPTDITVTRNVDVIGGEAIVVGGVSYDTAHIRYTVGGTTTDEWHNVNGCSVVRSVSGSGSTQSILELESTTCV
jgi:hypothetical protein